MNVLVTGGLGFIGSHLVEALVKRGDEVTIVDDCSSGRLKEEFSKNVLNKTKIVNCEINAFHSTEEYDIIYHLAAKPWSKEGGKITKENMFTTNTLGTHNLVSNCGNNTLFVFFSTANVYGNGIKFIVGDKINPSSMYGYTKAVAERIVELSGKKYVIFRPGTVVGTRGRCFPNRLVWSAVNNKPIDLFNNGDTCRDLIDVRDVVSVLLNVKELPFPINNLGSNRQVIGKELVKLVAEVATNHGYKLRHGTVKDYPQGYVTHSSLITRLKKDKLFIPKYSLSDTIETLFNYYKSGGIEPPRWESL